MAKKKKGGCLSSILTAVVALALFGSTLDSDVNTSSTNQTDIMATVSVTEQSTVQPSVVPVTVEEAPEAPEAPDFSSMPFAEAVQIIAAASDNFSCKTLAISLDPDVITVDVGMMVYDKRSNLQDNIQYCIDFAEMLFDKTDANMCYLKFWETNAAGAKTSCPVTMRLSRDKAALIDFDYYRANVTEETAFLSLLNGHSLSGEYKKALN